MIVFRFMSNEEYNKYRNGEELVNNKDFTMAKSEDIDELGNKIETKVSNSIGFCFFDINDYDPIEAHMFLSGIVSKDICSVFYVDKEKLNKSYGIYYPKGRDKDPYATEYCTQEYNKNDFKELTTCFIPEDSWNFSNWKWIDNIDELQKIPYEKVCSEWHLEFIPKENIIEKAVNLI